MECWQAWNHPQGWDRVGQLPNYGPQGRLAVLVCRFTTPVTCRHTRDLSLQEGAWLHHPTEDVMEQAECWTRITSTCSVRVCGRTVSAPLRLSDSGHFLTTQGTVRKGGSHEQELGHKPDWWMPREEVMGTKPGQSHCLMEACQSVKMFIQASLPDQGPCQLGN